MPNPMAPSAVPPRSWVPALPILCAVHCLVTPVVLAASPLLALGAGVEWSLLGLTVFLGALALATGLRAHGSRLPALLIVSGIAVWAGSLLGVPGSVPEDVTTPVSALVAATGLVWNARLSRHRVPACDFATCESATTDGESLGDPR